MSRFKLKKVKKRHTCMVKKIQKTGMRITFKVWNIPAILFYTTEPGVAGSKKKTEHRFNKIAQIKKELNNLYNLSKLC